MGIKALIRRTPGLVSAVRLGRRMIAVIRRFRAGKPARETVGQTNQSVLSLSDRRHRFVGYYDHSPFKPNDERLLLVHATYHPVFSRPSPNVPVYIELINHEDGTVVRELGYSYAWNWQQGARALWLNSETVIFNIYDDATDSYRARMVNCDGTLQGDLPIPRTRGR